MNTNATVIGLDIAKDVFVAVGLNARGQVVLKKKLVRHGVLAFFANLPATAVGIEACAGAHYWARELGKLGHDARLIAAQHVKSFVLGNKNDTRDAQAIAEIRARASTKYVPINTAANQDLQMLHRARQGLMQARKAELCRLRAFAHEYGKVFPVGANTFRTGLRAWLDAPDHGLSAMALETLRDGLAQVEELTARLIGYDKRIARSACDARARRLMAVPSIGPLTATAIARRRGRSASLWQWARSVREPRTGAAPAFKRRERTPPRYQQTRRCLLAHPAHPRRPLGVACRQGQTRFAVALGGETRSPQRHERGGRRPGEQSGTGRVGDARP